MLLATLDIQQTVPESFNKFGQGVFTRGKALVVLQLGKFRNPSFPLNKFSLDQNLHEINVDYPP